MSLEELVGSITMAVDSSDEIISLQELLEIALEQIDHPKKECRQSRTVLLLMCYLDRVKPHQRGITAGIKRNSAASLEIRWGASSRHNRCRASAGKSVVMALSRHS